LSFYEGVGVRVGDLKNEKWEVLCTDSTALHAALKKQWSYNFTPPSGTMECTITI
jgi:hypothetical protein